MEIIEKIRKEIERRLKYTHDWLRGCEKRHPNQTFISKNYYKMKGDERTLDTLLNFLDTLSEEPDKSLEEAAEKWCKENGRGFVLRDKSAYYIGETLPAFIAGAEWMKQQMLKGAKDGYVSAIIIHNNGDEEHYAVTYPNGKRPHSITDKVKIIIL